VPYPTRNPIALPEAPDLRPANLAGQEARFLYLRAVGKVVDGTPRPAVAFTAYKWPSSPVAVRVQTSPNEFFATDGLRLFSPLDTTVQRRDARRMPNFWRDFGFGASLGFYRSAGGAYIFDQYVAPLQGWWLNADVYLVTEEPTRMQHLVAIAPHVPGVTDTPGAGTGTGSGTGQVSPPMTWAQARALAKAGRYVRRRAWPPNKVLTYWAGAGTTPAVAMVFEQVYSTGGSGLVTTTVRRVAANSDFGRLEFEVADWEAGRAPA
jgi:hypothetical protein